MVAVPRDERGRSERVQKAVGRGGQEAVDSHRTVGCVNRVEVAEADDQHREVGRCPGSLDRVGQPLDQERPSDQPGRRIVLGAVPHLSLHRPAFGDVGAAQHEPGNAGVVATVFGGDLEVTP